MPWPTRFRRRGRGRRRCWPACPARLAACATTANLRVEQLPSGVADDARPEVRQLAAGRGVKRHRLHRRGAHPVVEGAQPGPHLTGGPRGERHREHLSRRDVPGRHEVGDAAGDGAGLAGARAGQHAHRTPRGQDGLALLVVEVVDDGRARGPRPACGPSCQGVADKTGHAAGMFGPSDYVECLMTAAPS